MYITLNYQFLLRRRTAFVHTNPTIYFLTHYVRSSSTLIGATHQKLPRIPRKSLVKLL